MTTLLPLTIFFVIIITNLSPEVTSPLIFFSFKFPVFLSDQGSTLFFSLFHNTQAILPYTITNKTVFVNALSNFQYVGTTLQRNNAKGHRSCSKSVLAFEVYISHGLVSMGVESAVLKVADRSYKP